MSVNEVNIISKCQYSVSCVCVWGGEFLYQFVIPPGGKQNDQIGERTLFFKKKNFFSPPNFFFLRFLRKFFFLSKKQKKKKIIN